MDACQVRLGEHAECPSYLARIDRLLGDPGEERVIRLLRHDAWRQVGLDVVVEPALAILFGFPDLDDPPPASRAGPARMADKPLASRSLSHNRRHLVRQLGVGVLGQLRFSNQQYRHRRSPPSG